MKWTKGICIVAFSGLLLTACDNEVEDHEPTSEVGDGETGVEEGTTDLEVTHGTLQDGTYELVETNTDDNGWRVEFTIEVEEGEIISSDYNEYDEEGNLKTEDDAYQEAMAAETGVGPQEVIPELNDQLMNSQDVAEVDVVSGATGTSEKFQEYAAMLLNAAENGGTETIGVDN